MQGCNLTLSFQLLDENRGSPYSVRLVLSTVESVVNEMGGELLFFYLAFKVV